MGAAASINPESTPDVLAKAVGEIAPAYSAYAERLIADGVNGEIVFGTSLDELLDALEVKNAIHRKRLKNELEKLVQGKGENEQTNASIVGEQLEGNQLPPSSHSPTLPPGSPKPVHIKDLVQRASAIVEQTRHDQLENIQHFFLSYRQKTETPLVNSLYMGIKARVADIDFGVTGKKPKVFLDIKSLVDGESWELGFVQGLLYTMMFVPIVSWHADNSGSVAQLVGVGVTGSDHCDNVLLEWELALVLSENKQSLMKSICPVLLGGTDNRGFLSFPFANLSKISDQPSLATKARLVELCEKYGVPLSEAAVRRSVKGTVDAILRNQGIKLDDLGKEVIAMTSCINRVFDTGSSILLSIGLEQPVSSTVANAASTIAQKKKALVSASLVFPPGVGPSYANNIAYMFCETQYCKWNMASHSVVQGPKNIQDGWEGYPYDHIDATLIYTPNGPDYTKNYAYLFYKDTYCKWDLTHDNLKEGPKNISSWEGYPYDHVDAIVVYPPGVGPAYATDAAYFFCGDMYCKWDLKNDTLKAGPRAIKDGWPGCPFNHIDGSLIFTPGVGPEDCQDIVFLFCGDQYCKWDMVTDSLKQGAKYIKDGFPGYSFA